MTRRVASMLGWCGQCVVAGLCLTLASPASAQDLDPRAYAHVPIDATFLVWGFGVSEGGIVTDPTLAVTNVQATVLTPSLGVGRSFNLSGRTAQAFVALPYSFADIAGNVSGVASATERTGFSDMRMRVSWLVRGAPAASIVQIAKAPRRAIIGTSLNIAAPTGQYYPDKLLNLGTNRWSVRPELALSLPFGQGWLLDAYAGVWFFAANNESYPGTQVKTQAPLGSFQTHLSYNFEPQLWVAWDLTYYVGGRTTVEGTPPTDLQSNVRAGLTAVLPVGQRHSIKIAASRGAIVRLGANFTSYSVAWQTSWVPRPGSGGGGTQGKQP
jgi:hypothetical protein